ncbi:MAG TPA: YciI family protein [Candidatus Bathyarchaeia archaeon]|nr:YciI family protein [Candidatus Bathyarchaeia archaeon]
MLYMLLIYANEAGWEAFSDDARAQVMREHAELEADLIRSGKYRSCEALQPIRAATTVRIRDGRTLVTDGPFAETKEQLGGYYIVEAGDLDDATAIAARIPTARNGSIEIRPIQRIER